MKQAPLFASERSAAQLLDMTPRDFRELVEAGHLPPGREIAPGLVRWDVEDLRRVMRGEAVDGTGCWDEARGAAVELGQKNRQARVNRGKTLQEAAKEMGISPAELSRRERGLR